MMHTAPPIWGFYSNDFGVSQSKKRTLPYKTWGSGGIILWALLTVSLVWLSKLVNLAYLYLFAIIIKLIHCLYCDFNLLNLWWAGFINDHHRSITFQTHKVALWDATDDRYLYTFSLLLWGVLTEYSAIARSRPPSILLACPSKSVIFNFNNAPRLWRSGLERSPQASTDLSRNQSIEYS